MAQKIGTYDLQDLLALTSLTVTTFGTDKANAIIQADLARHNGIVSDMLGTLCGFTEDRLLPWGGGGAGGYMDEVDEYGRTGTVKPTQAAGTIGIPLRLFQYAVGFTQRYLKNQTVADLARRTLAAQESHISTVERDLKRAIYRASNYTFRDTLVDQVDLPVKRFLNADGMTIPNGINRQTFDGATHTHYLANNGITNAKVKELEDTIVEHGKGRGLRLVINYTNETVVRALTDFVKFEDPRIEQFPSTSQIARERLSLSEPINPYSRDIGYIGNAVVQIRPWAAANYALMGAFGETNKPIMVRSRNNGTGGLTLAAENEAFPLIAQFYEAEFGIAAVERDQVAILDFSNASPGNYVDPV